MVSRRGAGAGSALGPARRRRRSGAPVRVEEGSGPFFCSRRVLEAAVRIPFWWLDLAALATAGSDSVWEAAAGVSGRWRLLRDGSEWIFLVLAFLGKQGRYTTALGLLVRSMAWRSFLQSGKCSGAVRGCLRGLNTELGWHRGRRLSSSTRAKNQSPATLLPLRQSYLSWPDAPAGCLETGLCTGH